MANRFIRQDKGLGNYRKQYHFYFDSDGAAGDFVDKVLIDPVADLGLKSSARLHIEKIQYNLSGCSARVEFDSGLVDDKQIWVLTEGTDNCVDFLQWGSMIDESGVDGTGKIQMTTTGLSSAGDQGSLLIQIKYG